MDTTVWTALVYLAISITVALLVGWTLHKSGRIFLVEVFQGKEDLADSVNHLLVVGFYLVSIGFVTLVLRYGAEPYDTAGAIEFLSTKVGMVLLVLGGAHFLNLFLLSRLRWRIRLVAPQKQESVAPPPEPQEHLTSAGGPGPQDL